MAAARFSLVLRLEDDAGEEIMATNLQQTKTKLSLPLRESIERFCRYYNRRSESEILEADMLHAYLDSQALDPEKSLSIYMGTKSRLDLVLRIGPASIAPVDDRIENKPQPEKESIRYEKLDIQELPPPNDFVSDKQSFDRVLHGIADDVVLVVLFQLSVNLPDPTSSGLAPAYSRMAHHFWPKVIMVRADIHGDIAKACNAALAPTVVFFKNHDAVDVLVACTDMQINVKISRLLKE